MNMQPDQQHGLHHQGHAEDIANKDKGNTDSGKPDSGESALDELEKMMFERAR